MGYTVSGVHRRRPIHHHVGKGPVFVKPKNTQPVAKSTHPPPLPAKEEPVEALTFSQEHGPGAAESEGESGGQVCALATCLYILLGFPGLYLSRTRMLSFSTIDILRWTLHRQVARPPVL